MRGIWERIHEELFSKAREYTGRKAEPTLGIIDIQYVKTSAEAADYSGYDGAKKIKGRKRHIVVNILGNLMAMKVHYADISDRDGSNGVLRGFFKKFLVFKRLCRIVPMQVIPLRITLNLGMPN